MAKKYHVTLSGEERSQLKQLLSKGKLSARTLKRAQILLLFPSASKYPENPTCQSFLSKGRES